MASRGEREGESDTGTFEDRRDVGNVASGENTWTVDEYFID